MSDTSINSAAAAVSADNLVLVILVSHTTDGSTQRIASTSASAAPAPQPKSANSDDEGMGGGTVAGVVIAVLACLALVAFVALQYSKNPDGVMTRNLSKVGPAGMEEARESEPHAGTSGTTAAVMVRQLDRCSGPFSHAFPSRMLPLTRAVRRAPCSTRCLCVWETDWCLQTDDVGQCAGLVLAAALAGRRPGDIGGSHSCCGRTLSPSEHAPGGRGRIRIGMSCTSSGDITCF